MLPIGSVKIAMPVSVPLPSHSGIHREIDYLGSHASHVGQMQGCRILLILQNETSNPRYLILCCAPRLQRLRTIRLHFETSAKPICACPWNDLVLFRHDRGPGAKDILSQISPKGGLFSNRMNS